jgi:hypothetical protein
MKTKTDIRLDYDYRFHSLSCTVCGKKLGYRGLYIEQPIDFAVKRTPLEYYDHLMIDETIHYEIRCEKCMPTDAVFENMSENDLPNSDQ